MNVIKRIALLLLFVALTIIIFLFDIVRNTVQIDSFTILLVRDLLIFVAFISFYFFLRQQDLLNKTSPQLLAKLLSAILIAGGVLLVSRYLFQPSVELTQQQAKISYRDLYSISIVAFALGTLGVLTYAVLRQFIFFKRKKWTRRYFYLYSVLFLTNSFLISKNVIELGSTESFFLFIPLNLLVIILSFRQSWIIVLSKREKLYTLVLSLLLSISFSIISVLANKFGIISNVISFYCQPLGISLSSIYFFGAVYFGFTFFSTLFHFPTAEIYERKQAELQSLHTLNLLVRQVFDYQQLVTNLVTITRKVSDSKSCWIVMYEYDADNDDIKKQIAVCDNITTQHAQLLSDIIKITETKGEAVKPIVIEDLWRDKRTKVVRNYDIPRLAMIVIPLVFHDELKGALYALKSVEEGFYKDDIEVLSTIADHGSIAIENSRLIEKSLERERLKQELLVAQHMQQQLFPQAMPQYTDVEFSAISIPSTEVGGDYYDIIMFSSEQIGIIVGDVSGKGVSAAFYMAEVKGIFLALGSFYLSPREFLIKANKALMQSLDKKSFVSLVYGILDRTNATFRFARAGHCPVLYYSNNTVQILKPSGIGVGLTKTDLFDRFTEEVVLHLKPDDILVFYTDGIVEARNSEGEEFGIERLVELVKKCRTCNAKTLQEIVYNSVLSFIGNSSSKDDITLLVVKWKGNS